MRPRITRHSSSAIVLIALMTSAQGACWSNRSRIGRTSILPIRRRQQAASLATIESGSSSNFEQQRNGSRRRRAQRQPPARISGASCRSNDTITFAGKPPLRWAAALSALFRPNPCTIFSVTLRWEPVLYKSASQLTRRASSLRLQGDLLRLGERPDHDQNRIGE